MVVLYHNLWYIIQQSDILTDMRIEAQKLGQNFKRIRKEKGISQGDIARTLGMDKAFISNVENGKTNPTLATIAKLAKAIGVSVSELMRMSA
ncbi:MAG: helix-turn-helix transcriptional regulator [Candidatus Izemoplasmatales bacterium]|nr:helix-turn-helix transcriptional regulator [Candidatus Izemoplasmatales bacterium]